MLGKRNILFLLSLLLCLNSGQALAQPDELLEQQLKQQNKLIRSGSFTHLNYLKRADLQLKLGDTSKALVDYENAIKYAPDSSISFSARAYYYSSIHDTSKAYRDFSKAIALSPSAVTHWINRARFERELQHWGQAEADYMSAIEVEEDNMVAYSELFSMLVSNSELLPSKALEQNLLTTQKSNPMAWITLAGYYSATRQPSKAFDAWEKALELSERSPEILAKRALFMDEFGNDRQAVEDCNEAIERASGVGYYYFLRARAYFDLKDFTSTLRDCEKAFLLDSTLYESKLLFARVLELYEQYDEARNYYKEVVDNSPAISDAFLEWAVMEQNLGEYDRALQLLYEGMIWHRDQGEMLLHVGAIQLNAGRIREAQLSFEKLVLKHPAAVDGYYWSGIVNDSLGNSELACDYMEKAYGMGYMPAREFLKENCKNRLNAKTLKLEELFNSALRRESEGNFELAIQLYSEAMTIAPDSSVLYYNRGKAKRRLEQHTSAIEDYLKAIELDNDRVEYWVAMGVTYHYLDNTERAIEAYEQAIVIDPYYSKSYFNIAITHRCIVRFNFFA